MTASALDDSPLLVTALLFGPLLLGTFQHLATEPSSRSWHRSLNKSPYRPPGYVFPLAWIWSYLSLGYASLLIARDVPDCAARTFVAGLYLVHLVLMNSWGVCFMVLRRMDYGLNVLVAMDVLLAVLLVSVSTLKVFASVLCLPYFCWLLELTYLNMYMWRNNEQGVSKADVLAMHAAPLVEEDEGSAPYAGVREVPTGVKED